MFLPSNVTPSRFALMMKTTRNSHVCRVYYTIPIDDRISKATPSAFYNGTLLNVQLVVRR